MDSAVFKQKIYSSFLQMRGGRLQNWSFFVDVINVWTLTSQTFLFVTLRVAQWHYGIRVLKLLKVCDRNIFSKFGITNVSNIEFNIVQKFDQNLALLAYMFLILKTSNCGTWKLCTCKFVNSQIHKKIGRKVIFEILPKSLQNFVTEHFEAFLLKHFFTQSQTNCCF